MVVVRWVLALSTVAYALWSALPAVSMTLFKLDRLPSSMLPDTRRYIPLIQATPWWQVGIWLLADLLYLFAAFRVVSRPKAAFAPALVAALLDVTNWVIAKQRPVYERTFSPAELQLDYIILGGVVVAVMLYWACSRVRTKRVQVAVLSE